jgi:hypothetical protein
MRTAVHRMLEAYLEAAQREAALQSIEHAASLSIEANAVVQDTLSDLLAIPALLRAAGGSGRSAGGVLLSTVPRQQPASRSRAVLPEASVADAAADSALTMYASPMTTGAVSSQARRRRAKRDD